MPKEKGKKYPVKDEWSTLCKIRTYETSIQLYQNWFIQTRHEKQANKMWFQVGVGVLWQNRIFVWVWSLSWQKEIRKCTLCFILATFLILQHWLSSFSIEEYTALVQFEVIRKIWLLWKKIKIWKELTSIFNIPIRWLLWNGFHGVTMVGLEGCNKVSTVTCAIKEQSAKYLSHAQRVSKIKTLVWVVLILLIKKQVLTNWMASHVVGFINLDYFLIWQLSLL